MPFSVPHTPIQEEEKWLTIYKASIENDSRRAYAASVTHMDYAIGQLIKTLDDEKLRENTLVIFFSDNGGQENWTNVTDKYDGIHGPYDSLGDNRPLRDWKGSLYEGGIRVPAVFNWPGKIKAAKVNEIISVNDIFPSLTYLAGINLPSQAMIEGDSVWKALVNGTPLGRRTFYWRTNGQFALRKGDWKLIYTGKTLDEGNHELFNLANDPYEKQDVAKDNHDIVASMLEEVKMQAELDMI